MIGFLDGCYCKPISFGTTASCPSALTHANRRPADCARLGLALVIGIELCTPTHRPGPRPTKVSHRSLATTMINKAIPPRSLPYAYCNHRAQLQYRKRDLASSVACLLSRVCLRCHACVPCCLPTVQAIKHGDAHVNPSSAE